MLCKSTCTILLSALVLQTAAFASLPSCDKPAPEEPETFDLLVVGAGISGLAAAKKLQELDPKWSVALLDAKNRVGGKSYGMVVDEGEQSLDYGGQWLGRNHDDMYALVEELGLKTFRAP